MLFFYVPAAAQVNLERLAELEPCETSLSEPEHFEGIAIAWTLSNVTRKKYFYVEALEPFGSKLTGDLGHTVRLHILGERSALAEVSIFRCGQVLAVETISDETGLLAGAKGFHQ
ncbi:MAG: hypothetical protein AAF479_03535 [Pseudomonadota bacterium]